MATSQPSCSFFRISVLEHLEVDTRTLLEQRSVVLDGTDCADVKSVVGTHKGSQLSRLMQACLNCAKNEDRTTKAELNLSHSRAIYLDVRRETDPLPDSALINPVLSAQHDDPVPIIEILLLKLSYIVHFAILDSSRGYWQLRLHKLFKL